MEPTNLTSAQVDEAFASITADLSDPDSKSPFTLTGQDRVEVNLPREWRFLIGVAAWLGADFETGPDEVFADPAVQLLDDALDGTADNIRSEVAAIAKVEVEVVTGTLGEDALTMEQAWCWLRSLNRYRIGRMSGTDMPPIAPEDEEPQILNAFGYLIASLSDVVM